MATFSKVPLEEAQRSVMPPRRAVQELYRQYISQLSSTEAGQLELGPDDKSITERARLKAAARTAGITLHIQRRGSTMVFWETDEPPRTRAKTPAKSAASGGRGRKASR
jgi:hypothetical protein